MKIFLSYGHDSNAPLIEKIKEYLSKDVEGNLAYMEQSSCKVSVEKQNSKYRQYGTT